MKILFLDDDKNRHKRFMMENIGRDITYVWTAEEAIKAIKENYFDEMSLDHDLDFHLNGKLPSEGDGSGYDVALFIAKLPPERRPKRVILHTFNHPGGLRMRQALKECSKEGMAVIYIPFGS